MNNLKLSYKIVMANIAIAFIIAIFVSLTSGGFHTANDFAFGFGLVCLGSGFINLILGLASLVAHTKEWRYGFFISCGILLLLSGISCGGGLAFVK